MISIGFDISGFDQNAKEDQEGIQKSSKFCEFRFKKFIFYFYFDYFLVNNLVEEEIKNGISPKRIVSKRIS